MQDQPKQPRTADNRNKTLEKIKSQINNILPDLRSYNNPQHLVELFESVVETIDDYLVSERKKIDEGLEKFKDPQNRHFNRRD